MFSFYTWSVVCLLFHVQSIHDEPLNLTCGVYLCLVFLQAAPWHSGRWVVWSWPRHRERPPRPPPPSAAWLQWRPLWPMLRPKLTAYASNWLHPPPPSPRVAWREAAPATTSSCPVTAPSSARPRRSAPLAGPAPASPSLPHITVQMCPRQKSPWSCKVFYCRRTASCRASYHASTRL